MGTKSFLESWCLPQTTWSTQIHFPVHIQGAAPSGVHWPFSRGNLGRNVTGMSHSRHHCSWSGHLPSPLPIPRSPHPQLSLSGSLGGMIQTLILRVPEPLVTMPFSSQGYLTWPFTVTPGLGSTKKQPGRTPGIHTYSSVSPLWNSSLFTIRLNTLAMSVTSLLDCWSLDTRSSKHPGGRLGL